jgi:hypothetical protein
VVIVFNQIRSMDLTGRFPHIVIVGVAHPFDQILKLF